MSAFADQRSNGSAGRAFRPLPGSKLEEKRIKYATDFVFSVIHIGGWAYTIISLAAMEFTKLIVTAAGVVLVALLRETMKAWSEMFALLQTFDPEHQRLRTATS